MEPRLIAVSGPRNGETFALTSESLIIGRDCDSLLLNDPSASRRHCSITMEGSQFKIVDLESRNGTSVNGIPIKERILKDGDRIEIGNSMFLFLSGGELQNEPSISATISENEPVILSTVRARLKDILNLSSGIDASHLPIPKIMRSIQGFFRIADAIGSIRSLQSLQTELIKILFDFVPAQRGAILIAEDHLNDLHSILGVHKDKTETAPVSVNRNIAIQVLKEDSAILGNDVQIESNLSASILCAPLKTSQCTVGALYLETADPNVRFDEDHLQFVTAIAGIAAVAIQNCMYLEELQNQNDQLKADLNIEHNMIGESAVMRNVFDFVARVAPSDSTVLILGETGTGKELVSRAIHQNSKRSQKSFVAINCATLSETLLESELFGHEKGSFTGAVAQKKGKFEIADGGTVFLDEIAEIALSLQAKLLRVLQERQFERIGGIVPISVNIRIIAATNKNLSEEVQKGLFRQDLFYRLNVLQLTMPSLRQRVEDIPLLAAHFAAKYSAKMGKKIARFSPEARKCLVCYHWPGNVRELENAIERALVLGTVDMIRPEDLPETIIESQPRDVPITRYQEAVKEAKRQLILKAMKQANDNYVEAANILEIHPNNLHRLIRDLDLKSSLKK
ncbi:MAG TPA: sigma 54-interacting transcriptional regulator [Acidobacteriota bacterium]|nr:sigma 54-interacting transcriptional regulator [Acidobacteriota bacterium]